MDPKTKQCSTLAGTGVAGDTVGPEFNKSCFNEPGGICAGDGGKLLYVADTNNHQVKVLDLASKTVSLVSNFSVCLHILKPVCESKKSFLIESVILDKRRQRKDILSSGFFVFFNPDVQLSLSHEQFPIFTEVTDSAPSKPSGTPKVPTLPKSATRKEMPPVAVSAGQTVTMSVTISLPEGAKLTGEAPSCWALSSEGETMFS